MEPPWYIQLLGVYLLLVTALVVSLWVQYYRSPLVMRQLIPYLTLIIVLWGIWLESSVGLFAGLAFRVVVEKYYPVELTFPCKMGR